jgi:nucleoside-diphosphate-sugar epimerase
MIIGGTGQIGRAVARNLLEHGWRVTLAQRSSDGLPEDLAEQTTLTAVDREQPGALGAAIGSGFDAVIDTIAFTEDHARQLLQIGPNIGGFVVISSGSVYRDSNGRTLDGASQTGFPQFPIPISEDQPTVDPGPNTYSTRKAAMEQTLLQQSRSPVTILRPGAIYGDGSRHPREWWFVKRIRDGRRRVPLAFGGESRFHTSSTANIAELCRLALDQPGTRVLNAVDPTAPTVAEIGLAIAAVYEVNLDLVYLEGPPRAGVGSHPWCIPSPIVMDMACSHALGYRPVIHYQEAVADACRSAERAADAGATFPNYINALFDYAAEDLFFVESKAVT